MKKLIRICSLLLLFVGGGSLWGCKAVELEDRSFPMLVTVGLSDRKQTQFRYVFANEWSDINSYLDYNHLKVVLIEEDFLEEEKKYQDFLAEVQREETFPRNTYVCVTADADEICDAGETLAIDVGTYIENMLQTKERMEKNHLPTVGDLVDDKENQMRIWKLPVLSVKDGQIAITDYYQIAYGSPSASRES